MKISKKILVILLFVILIFNISCVGHIDDINGEDDFSLAVITEEEIANKFSSIKVTSTNYTSNNTTKINIKKMSGIDSIIDYNKAKGKTLKITFTVESGNALLAFVEDEQIKKVINPNTTVEYMIPSNSRYDLKLAGESCKVQIEIVEIN